MSIVKLTAPAFFYVVMSAGLNHGHSFWFESSEICEDGFVLVDLPLIGKLDCHQSDWDETRQEYVEREVVLGIREVHMLHQLQGRLVNREAMEGFAGLEGWETTQDRHEFKLSHKTATGRLRLGLVSKSWGSPSAATEQITIEVCAGDGKTVAAVFWRDSKWEPWYGAAEGMHGGSDDMPILKWLARHNGSHRPDRFWTLAEILFDGEGNWLLPGESLADVEHWGVGAAIKACLSGTAFDIADAHKASLPQEEPKPFDSMEAFE